MNSLFYPVSPIRAGARQSASAMDELSIDRITFRDLEIFEAPAGTPSLYNLLNRTRTYGGSIALRNRMPRPWCAPARIKGVQDSLRFIAEHRELFGAIPNEGMTAALERYIHSGLPIITAVNRLEWLLEAIEVRFTEGRDYVLIRRGVEHTIRLIQLLHDLAVQCELTRTLSFDFVLRPGVSDQRLGMRVLREEGVIDLVDRIPRMS